MELVWFADFLAFCFDLKIKSSEPRFSAILATHALCGALFGPSGLVLRAGLT